MSQRRVVIVYPAGLKRAAELAGRCSANEVARRHQFGTPAPFGG